MLYINSSMIVFIPSACIYLGILQLFLAGINITEAWLGTNGINLNETE